VIQPRSKYVAIISRLGDVLESLDLRGLLAAKRRKPHMACALVCVIVLVAGWFLGSALAFMHACWHDTTVLRNVQSKDDAHWQVAVATFWGVVTIGCVTRHEANVLFNRLWTYRMLLNTHRPTQSMPFTVVLERGVAFDGLRLRFLGALTDRASSAKDSL